MVDVKVRVVDCYVYCQTDDGLKFLILKRNEKKLYEHLWQGVAGKIEKNEEAWQAAIRELKEETGLKPTGFSFPVQEAAPVDVRSRHCCVCGRLQPVVAKHSSES